MKEQQYKDEGGGRDRKDESRMTTEHQLNKSIYMCARKREKENNESKRRMIKRANTHSDDCLTEESVTGRFYCI